jgi:uncharacterized protein YdeI (YjbR/CyaY-like superfamily)
VTIKYHATHIAKKVEHWSQSYIARFAKLGQEGLVNQSGINSVIASKESALWNFMDDVDNLLIPEDLQQIFKNTSCNSW